jgi:hypothetical protein
MKSDLSKVKVDDKIWTIENGWVTITGIEHYDTYQVKVENYSYTFDGKISQSDKFPSAFLEYPFKEQEIEKDTIVWFRGHKDNHFNIGYYSHYDMSTDLHHVFISSKKSNETTDTDVYHEVRTENPLL